MATRCSRPGCGGAERLALVAFALVRSIFPPSIGVDRWRTSSLAKPDRRVRPASSGDQHRDGLGGPRSPGSPGSQWRVENEPRPAGGGGDRARQPIVSAPLWRYFAPLAWLQFPWRWMLPATLLATTAVCDEAPKRGRLLFGVALAAILTPAGRPTHTAVRTRSRAFAVATDPIMAGERVMESFSGNPLLVDVMEHRPLWWEDLGETMVLLGPRQTVLVPEGGASRVVSWRPLEREIEVESRQPTTLVLRLLADPHWMINVNQRPTPPDRWGAALAVSLPPGRSQIEVGWATDPRAIAGAIVAAILLTLIVLRRRRLRATC